MMFFDFVGIDFIIGFTMRIYDRCNQYNKTLEIKI
jgi:hypothetical protein